MSSKPVLRLDWCSHAAAKYAVEHWHYSRRMPVGKMVKVGVWENDVFVGCVIFARGNTPTLGDSYGLAMTQVAELVRVALTRHVAPVSRILSVAIKFFKNVCPGIRLIVSFADPAQGHHGGIYQAMGWVYSGDSSPSFQWLHEGRWKHNREMTSGAFGKPRKCDDLSVLPKRLPLGKYRYLYPLDDAMREQIAPLAKPYPKRSRAGSVDSDTLGVHPGEGGAVPTSALHDTATRESVALAAD